MYLRFYERSMNAVRKSGRKNSWTSGYYSIVRFTREAVDRHVLCLLPALATQCHYLNIWTPEQMSSEASRLAVSIGGVEERVSSEAKLVQQERANLEKHKRRLQAGKVKGVSFFFLFVVAALTRHLYVM